MKTFIAIVKVDSHEGLRAHKARLQADSLEDALLKFGQTIGSQDFIGFKAFNNYFLNDSSSEAEYGIVIPIHEVREVLITEE